MDHIEKILDMLNWHQPEEVQQQGIILAASVKDLTPFLQPVNAKHNKNVWENCAMILITRSDEELVPYLPRLLEWLQDLNWPGALIILDRLKIFSGEKLKRPFMELFVYANSLHNEEGLMWLDSLSDLLDNEQLKAMLPKEATKTLQKHYHNCGFWWDDEEEKIHWDLLE